MTCLLGQISLPVNVSMICNETKDGKTKGDMEEKLLYHQ